jgi:DNA-binding beta-propeller fold protein YncE
MRSAFVHAIAGLAGLATSLSGAAVADDSFVNFESGHTRPLALSPGGDLLFAVNTPNGSLSIFDVEAGGLVLRAEIPVGLEPVAVASRVNTGSGRTEAWVVNHLSDSVSVVEIDAADPADSRVRHTLLVGDEPRDIVFAGSPIVKAFVTTARRGQNLPEAIDPAFNEPGTPRALVWAFQAENVGTGIGGTPVAILEFFGDTPRALAASPDGSMVYAAVFHSGNNTTSLREGVVASGGGAPPPPPDSPYFGDPDIAERALVVRSANGSGPWLDELGRDWSDEIFFSLADKDVFAIDADANPPTAAVGVEAFRGVGTTLFNMAVRPGTGSVFVTNSEARNEVRFEPIEAGGVQGHATEQRITVLANDSVSPVHVNPHIDYSVATGPLSETDESVALLGDLAFSSDGASLYAAAMGSDSVAVFDAAALESGTVTRDLVDVGRGPSGVALDEANDRLYVMNRLDHTISVVSDASDAGLRQEASVVSVGADPTPAVILEGRPFLYGARGFSGHGDLACASCHAFGDTDQLAWELGNPYGALETNPNPILPFPPVGAPPLEPFSPIKGALTTQSLRGLADAGPMHWRGDRTAGNDPGGDAMDEDGAFKKFNAAFVELLGRAAPLTASEMQAFTDFVLTMRYPPNPVRALDNEMTREQETGLELFTTREVVPFTVPCAGCHELPLGTGGGTSTGVTNSLKVPHLRSLYQKVGKFGGAVNGDEDDFLVGEQVRGFGLAHEGAIPGPFEFASGFQLIGVDPETKPGISIAEFLISLDTGLAPAVGQQVTIGASPSSDRLKRLDLLVGRDAAGDCDLVFSGRIDGAPRLASVRPDGRVQLGDSELAPLDEDALLAMASVAGGEQTYTCRPPGTGRAATIDADLDGFLDGDELREGSDPTNASSTPYICAGGGALATTKMKITKNQLPRGDEKLSIKATWISASDIDPAADGFNFVLRTQAGEIVTHYSLPAAGWTTSDGARFSYAGPDGAVIPKAKLSIADDGEVKLAVKGNAGEFGVDTSSLVLVIVLGGSDEAASGACVTGTFGSGGLPACEVSEKKVKCG